MYTSFFTSTPFRLTFPFPGLCWEEDAGGSSMWDMLGAFKQSVANAGPKVYWSLITLVLLDLYCICCNFFKTVQLHKAELHLKPSHLTVMTSLRLSLSTAKHVLLQLNPSSKNKFKPRKVQAKCGRSLGFMFLRQPANSNGNTVFVGLQIVCVCMWDRSVCMLERGEHKLTFQVGLLSNSGQRWN